MSGFDLLVRGGTVATAEDVFEADVAVGDGRIAAIGTDLGDAARVVDATGAIVLPGAIDVHTHFETGVYGAATIDDFESGSRAAAFGGITSFINYAFQERGEPLKTAVERELTHAAGRCYVDYGFHLVPTDLAAGDFFAELAELRGDGHQSLKVFTAIDNYRIPDEDILRVMEAAAAHDMVVNVHAEDGPLINFLSSRLTAAGAGIEHLPEARPDYSEGLAVEKVAAYAQATGCKLYIVHLASLEALEAVRRARRRGVDVAIETRPTYLFWTRELYDLPGQAGRRYVFRPPLREQRDQDALWEAIAAGEIEVYATDHTSWLLSEKMNPDRDFVTIPGGLSLVETSLGMLYGRGVKTGRITLPQLVALTSTNPAKHFGMYPRKGTIAVGSDADLVVLDPRRRFTITTDAMQSRADFDPYEGVEVEGWPVVTISRGQVVVDHGELVGSAGWGRLLDRA